MSKEFKITKEKILAMAEECEEAKAVLKKGFPEAFKVPAKIEEWINITGELTADVGMVSFSEGYISLYHNEVFIAYTKSSSEIEGLRLELFHPNYKIELEGGDFKVFKKI